MRRSGTTTVTVCVTDINDNGPVFDQPTVSLPVMEDFDVELELFRVFTTDGDNIGTASDCPSEGINSSVVYSLVFNVRELGDGLGGERMDNRDCLTDSSDALFVMPHVACY